jgi:hypothetical protein
MASKDSDQNQSKSENVSLPGQFAAEENFGRHGLKRRAVNPPSTSVEILSTVRLSPTWRDVLNLNLMEFAKEHFDTAEGALKMPSERTVHPPLKACQFGNIGEYAPSQTFDCQITAHVPLKMPQSPK